MTRLLLLAAAAAALAGCSQSEPLIDHINVSDAKYNADLKACREQASGGWLPFSGGNVGDCMKSRGYHVLMGSGGL